MASGFIPKRVPWTRQPPPGTKIDSGNPITRGLVVAHAPAANGNDRNVVTGVALSNSREHRAVRGEQSIIYSSGGAGSAVDPLDTGVPATNSGDHTFLFWWRVDSVTGGNNEYYATTAQTGNVGWNLRANSQAGSSPNQTATLIMTYGGVAQYAQSTPNHSINGDFLQLGFSGTISSDFDYISEGKFDNNVSVGTINTTTDNVELYGYTNAGYGAQGEFALSLYWERRLSEIEIQSLYKNPWQIFQPQTQHIPISYGAAPAGFEPQWAYGSNHIIYGGTL